MNNIFTRIEIVWLKQLRFDGIFLEIDKEKFTEIQDENGQR